MIQLVLACAAGTALAFLGLVGLAAWVYSATEEDAPPMGVSEYKLLLRGLLVVALMGGLGGALEHLMEKPEDEPCPPCPPCSGVHCNLTGGAE